MKTLDTIAELRKIWKMDAAGQDAGQGTLYQVAQQAFEGRADVAMKAAGEGDFSLINQLEEEVNLLVHQFICHGLYLQEQRRLLQDPEGPEAAAAARILAAAKRNHARRFVKVEAGE